MLALKSALAQVLGAAQANEPHRPLATGRGADQRLSAHRPAAATGAPVRVVHARLTVTQGRHAGATLDLTKPHSTIGSALSNNVVLTDTDVQLRHATVSFADADHAEHSNRDGVIVPIMRRSNKLRSTVTIAAIDGNVLAGIQLIEAGKAIEVALPCTLKFGGCAIDLARPKPQRPSLIGGRATRATNRRWWVLPTIATLAAATGLSSLGLYKTVTGEWAPSKLMVPRNDAGTASRQPTVAANPAVRTPTLPQTLAGAGTPSPELASIPPVLTAPRLAIPLATPLATAKTAVASDDRQLAEVQQRLAAAGLDKILSVEQRGNMLVVDGIVSSATYGRWREVKDALTVATNAGGTGGRTSIITDLVKTSTSANVPNNSIASVILGKTPYVMSTNGRRARVGEVLEDGWTVEAITADTVTMRRGQAVNRINPADGFSK